MTHSKFWCPNDISGMVKTRNSKIVKFCMQVEISDNILERCKMEKWLHCKTNRKLYAAYQMAPLPMP